MKVTFLGAGVFGEALGKVATENGHEVSFYDPIKYPKVKLSEVANGADVILYTAPSDKYPEILPDLPKDTPIICASKGFLSLEPFAKFKHVGALGGAAFAEDIEKKHRIMLTTSSELAEEIFTTQNILVEYTLDTLGIMLCGTLKNIYALGAGLEGAFGLDGVEYLQSSNASSVSEEAFDYFRVAGGEMLRILTENGARFDTMSLSCGMDDLLISSSPHSRNFRFGRALCNGEEPETGTVEGAIVIMSLKDYKEFVIPDDVPYFHKIVDAVLAYQKKHK